MNGQLLDQFGKPLNGQPNEDLGRMRAQITALVTKMANDRLQNRRDIRAKFDAAQTFLGNDAHWGQADFLSPHLVANYAVRRTLRSRSRYELSENNPYLKGTCLTIVNDFVGSGPKLQITDERIPAVRAEIIQKKFQEWAYSIKLRQKLWRMRLAKIVDGEAFLMPYNNKNRMFYDPVQLDFQVLEAERITTQYATPVPSPQESGTWEVDGVRFDDNENPLAYHVLNVYPEQYSVIDRFTQPGIDPNSMLNSSKIGKWIPAKYLIHWFRQDRGWLRGIPEATSSLPLCAVLRRYTMAVVRNAEAMADITVLCETENPAKLIPNFGSDGSGNPIISDDPFDIFPLEMGMAMTLPWGYKSHQLDSVPIGVQFDEFVGCLLREITRPILSPYNISSGSSKDSNMASGVLDATIYKGGQRAERLSVEEEVMCRIFYLWWQEAIRIDGHIGGSFLSSEWRESIPQHRWGWDRIGIDHTDPARVADALKTMHEKRFMTDRDIQQEYFNRDLGVWQKEIKSDDTFRDSLIAPGLDAPPDPSIDPQTKTPGGKPASKTKPKAKSKAAK